jgi:prophage antirepressor-like protein
MTPQTQLTLSKIFDDKQIRAMEMNGELWVPVVDIAEAWGVDRSTLTKIINRNPDVFRKLSTVVDVTSPNKISPNSETVNNSLRLVNERGMIVLGLKVSAGHIKNTGVKDKIIEFQLWVPELLQDLRKGLVQLSTPAQPLTLHQARMPVDILKEELDVADELVSRSGLTKEQAHSYAVILAGERAGVNLQCYASAIKAKTTQLQLIEAEPIDREEFNKLHSLRDLSGMLKLPENKVRTVLESIGVIYFEHGIWKLTKRGEQYGKAFLVTIGYPYRTNQKAWIRYNDLCIDLLRKYFDIQLPVTKVE